MSVLQLTYAKIKILKKSLKKIHRPKSSYPNLNLKVLKIATNLFSTFKALKPGKTLKI